MPSRRILVVEDDADTREALADAMREIGADVATADDGVDAMERLRNGPEPTVILLDLRLPRLDGDAFLSEMRSDPRFERIPVITMTGGSRAVEGDDVVARLRKPFDFEDLRSIVESLFDS
jgi:CheY-like chemotaxis protein